MILSYTVLHCMLSPHCLQGGLLYLPLLQTICTEHVPTYSFIDLEDEFTGLQVQEGDSWDMGHKHTSLTVTRELFSMSAPICTSTGGTQISCFPRSMPLWHYPPFQCWRPSVCEVIHYCWFYLNSSGFCWVWASFHMDDGFFSHLGPLFCKLPIHIL